MISTGPLRLIPALEAFNGSAEVVWRKLGGGRSVEDICLTKIHAQVKRVKYMMTTLPTIRRVAIVGAGASGLVAARALREEGCFTAIDVFEQRGDVGGLWNYTPQTKATDVPSVDPNVVEGPDEKGTYISAVYDNLGASHHICLLDKAV